MMLGLPAGSLAQTPSSFDADGTLRIPEMTLETSELVSPQFKRAYVERLQMMRAFPRPPAPDAGKEQWDLFDAAVDKLLQHALDWNLRQYPVDVLDTRLGGVRVGVITPKGAGDNPRRVLINMHGGAFMAGRGLVAGQVESIPIAFMSKTQVITVDYRQAPYAQYPAASEDVESVYRELLKRYKPQSIGLFGCSAGGMLAAQALSRFQAKHLPRPGAVGIFCAAPPAPPAPFGKRGDSTMWGTSGLPVLNAPPRSIPYMETANPNDALAYPAISDDVLTQFPPTLLVSGTRSGEMSAVIHAHARFLKLGVDSELYLMEGGWHGAMDSAEDTPEGHDVNAYIARWFVQHLAPSRKR
jgi:acetyl esterase/lipase